MRPLSPNEQFAALLGSILILGFYAGCFMATQYPEVGRAKEAIVFEYVAQIATVTGILALVWQLGTEGSPEKRKAWDEWHEKLAEWNARTENRGRRTALVRIIIFWSIVGVIAVPFFVVCLLH